MRPLATACLMTTVLAAAPLRAAEVQTFESIGRAPISAGDRVRARQRALDDALQHAVEAAVGALLGPEALTRRAADLRLKILPRAKAYVTTYRVIEEGELEPGVFVVRIGAEVAADRLLRELADKRPVGPAQPSAAPKIALCVATQPAGVRLARLEAAVRMQLGARGLDPVPATSCDGEGIVAIGARMALVIEVQPGKAEPVRGTALVGREVKLALELVGPSGKRFADGHADEAGYGTSADEATDDAAVRAVAEAFAPIETALGAGSSASARGQAVSARLVGVRRFAQLASVRTALERIAGVESVEPRRFSPGLPGNIELAIRTTQSARALADGLLRVAASYQLRAHEADGQLVIEMLEPLDPAAAPGSPGSPQ